jgi:hypothetical protein
MAKTIIWLGLKVYSDDESKEKNKQKNVRSKQGVTCVCWWGGRWNVDLGCIL